jgi:hypothetical protein
MAESINFEKLGALTIEKVLTFQKAKSINY